MPEIGLEKSTRVARDDEPSTGLADTRVNKPLYRCAGPRQSSLGLERPPTGCANETACQRVTAGHYSHIMGNREGALLTAELFACCAVGLFA
jgi:hypothetical protein